MSKGISGRVKISVRIGLTAAIKKYTRNSYIYFILYLILYLGRVEIYFVLYLILYYNVLFS